MIPAVEEPYEISGTVPSRSLEDDLIETVERVFNREVAKEQLRVQREIEALQNSFCERFDEARAIYPQRSTEEIEVSVGAFLAGQINEARRRSYSLIAAYQFVRQEHLDSVFAYTRDRIPVISE